MMPEQQPGSILWTDLTVEDAERVRTFYSAVVGWAFSPVPMGGYSDYSMTTPHDGQAVAGICHARGVNAGLPAQWLVYIAVRDLDASMQQCVQHGGTVIAPARTMGAYGRFCVIRDPAGAVAALIEPPRRQPA